MMGTKQVQEAGDNSQQIQAHSVTIYQGIDEKRAREISQETAIQVMRDKLSEEARQIASERVLAMESCLLGRMSKISSALEAFADPSFLFLLADAQRTAAASDRPSDYELLTELLVHRFQKGGHRETKAGINRAVKIVDEISDEALLGLTIIYLVQSCVSIIEGSIEKGLSLLNDLFGALLYGDLPDDDSWIEHLDILGAVRITHFGRLHEIEEFYQYHLYGYTDVGIRIDSEEYREALNLMRENSLPISGLLVVHELNEGYVRLNMMHKDFINIPSRGVDINVEGTSATTVSPLTDAQRGALLSIYDLYEKNDEQHQNNIMRFMEKWNSFPNLSLLRQWWNNIRVGFSITAVGKVLAHANSVRYNLGIPPLD